MNGIKQNNIKYSTWLFILGVSYYTLGTAIDMYSTMLIGQNSIDTLVYLGLLIFLFILSKRGYWKIRVNFERVALPSVFFSLILFDYVLPSSITSVRQIMLNTFLTRCLIAYMVVASLTSISQIIRALPYIAYICFFSSIFMLFVPLSVVSLYDNVSEYGAYMFFGFRILLPVIFFFALYEMQKKKIYLYFALIGALLLIVFGNRGASVTIAVFLVLEVLLFSEYKKKARIIGAILVLLLLVMILPLESWVTALSVYLERFGIKSRNLELLLSNNLNYNNRSYIYEDAVELVKKHVIFGTGLSGAWRFNGNNPNSGYPHNIMLEMAIQFGLLPAIVLFILFLEKTIKILLNKYDQQLGLVYLAFFSVGIVTSFFSGSYCTSWYFWVLMSFFITAKKELKERQKHRHDLYADFEDLS